ncbi:MAG: protein kinase [Pyrinomonadaceae bacterium]
MKKCPKCGKEYKDTNSICTSDGTVLEKADDALVGQTLAEKYRIEERLSEGGMGTVYRGTHVLMDKTVAVKVLHPSLAADDKIVQRFSREARAASRISHPHALNVTDFGESGNGIVFLVMEYLNGRTLKEVIHQEGRMPLPRVVEIMRQVTGALAAAHAEGVVHRDLKSDNIMLMDADNGQDWAKVLDFGIAKIQEPLGQQDPALTAPNLIIGTPQYMSPEQCSQASELDARSDIYSLGVILYEMFAGHVPFTGESPTAIMMKHLQEPPPSLAEERADLPAAVNRVVMHALAKRPEDRYQTVGELADALTLAVESNQTNAAGAAVAASASERETARIVVPTAPNKPVLETSNTEHDEATVVVPAQPGRSPVVETESLSMRANAIPPPYESSNLGRILILSGVGLLVLFAVIYAISSRNSGQPATGTPGAQQLTNDANGQPVNPVQPPTGQSEKGIADGAPVAPSNANSNKSASANASPAASPNDGTAALPSAVNANTSRRNANGAEQATDTPADEDNSTPPDVNANNERRNPPKPQPTLVETVPDAEQPPSTPAPKKKQPPLPKPTELPDAPPPPAGESSAPGLPDR